MTPSASFFVGSCRMGGTFFFCVHRAIRTPQSATQRRSLTWIRPGHHERCALLMLCAWTGHQLSCTSDSHTDWNGSFDTVRKDRRVSFVPLSEVLNKPLCHTNLGCIVTFFPRNLGPKPRYKHAIVCIEWPWAAAGAPPAAVPRGFPAAA